MRVLTMAKCQMLLLFLQNNSSPNGWEGESAISFEGSSLDVYEISDSM